MSQLTIYRETTIGTALKESLKELENQIGEELTSKVLESFDNIICEKFKDINTSSKVKMQGKCISYNNCDHVWLFQLNDCSIKGDDIDESASNCRIVATEMQNREGNQRREPVRRGQKGTKGHRRGGQRQ